MADEDPKAFPSSQLKTSDLFETGMTLRDYFAAAALTGIVADSAVTVAETDEQSQVADWAYGLADAMMRQRRLEEEG